MNSREIQIQAVRTRMIKRKCEKDHLIFSRIFFKYRQNTKFKVNWHHRLISDVVQEVIDGKRRNVVINVSPGSSKTELVVINFIARGLALNPKARFLHLSYSDDLALLNSQTARDIVLSDDYQALWPLKISEDTKSKKRWNVMIDGQLGGGVYATSLLGQVTGFRAGHMDEGFTGAILVDDPLKPDDAFSKPKLDHANRTLLTTVKSRKANPSVPIVIIMQRVSENDPTGFIREGSLGEGWSHVVIPSVIDEAYVKTLPVRYQRLIERDGPERFSYWPYKEPIEQLLQMERGDGKNQTGSRISRHVFASQYQQNPVAIGGNLIKGEHFSRYTVTPKINYRKIFADTAQKTGERNDYSVFACYGEGDDNKLYLLDQIRGKWEAPELKRRAIEFWNKHNAKDMNDDLGQLREMVVEDKSSGTGLIQDIHYTQQIPIVGVERVKDKLTRVMDVLSYIEAKMVCVPANASFTSDFIAECEAFTADDSHAHDDMIDPLIDAIVDMIASGNSLKLWENLI